VFQGRDLVWQGAHAAGSNNVQNIGVCLIGNFDDEKPSAAALDALERLLDDLRKKHGIARSQVLGHGDLKKTDCPGKNLEPWVKRYSRPSS
jgi:N-acetyl-anhydromuramyl-L-alanine amidase AmpD